MGGAEPACGQHDVIGRHAAHLRWRGRGDLPHRVAHRVEAFGVLAYEAGVGHPFPQQHVQHRVEQHEVGAGQDSQVQIGHRRGVGAARVDHDDLQIRVLRAGILDAAEDDRMGVGGVAAGDEQAVRLVDVGVAGGRRIGAQRLLVAGDGRRHAQPRVGVDVVGADQSLGELVEDVIVLGQQLARDVEGHRIRAVLANDPREFRCGVVERQVPRDVLARLLAGGAQLGMQGAGFAYRGQMERRTLGAQPAEVGGVLGVAAHAGDAFVVMLDDDAAADAAVAAG